MLEQKVTILSAKPCLSQDTAEKVLLDGLLTALERHETASSWGALMYCKEPEKLLVDQEVVESLFSRFWVETQAKM